MFHGTPGSRLQVSFDPKAVAAAGVRLHRARPAGLRPQLVPPGPRRWPTGRRTSRPWRTTSRSNGSAWPACRAGDRTPPPAPPSCPSGSRVAGLVSGVGPHERARPGRGDGRRQSWVDDPGAARALHAAAALRGAGLRASVAGRRRHSRPCAKRMPEADAAVLARPTSSRRMVLESRQAPATAARAGAQDFSLFARPWGFRLQDISVPVHLWQGDAGPERAAVACPLHGPADPAGRAPRVPRRGPPAVPRPRRRDHADAGGVGGLTP